MATVGLRINPGAASHASTLVYITKTEYEGLLKISRQYENLCRSLRQGGVDDNAINLLSTDDNLVELSPQAPAISRFDTSTETKSNFTGTSQKDSCQPQVRDHQPPTYQGHHGSSSSEQQIDQLDWGDTEYDPSSGGTSFTPESREVSLLPTDEPRPRELRRIAQRSIYISNLPDGATHADIVAEIRGGQLLDIFLLYRDRAAIVAFLYGDDARDFYDHYRKHDLYIGNKRAEIKWADRQFTLPSPIAHKVTQGISRNLVIRNCDPNLSEASIRDDLEHIHNLVVIGVKFIRGDCFISTNSIHNAMFARTCMMSRQKFKRSRIEWDYDECDAPLPQPPIVTYQPEPLIKKPLNPMANRFELLSFDDDDY